MAEYRVVHSGKIQEDIRRLAEQAREEGRLPQAQLAAATLDNALRTDPLSFGEPLYDAKRLGLQVRHGVQSPWSFHFAVDKVRKIVYVTRVELLSKP